MWLWVGSQIPAHGHMVGRGSFYYHDFGPRL